MDNCRKHRISPYSPHKRKKLLLKAVMNQAFHHLFTANAEEDFTETVISYIRDTSSEISEESY